MAFANLRSASFLSLAAVVLLVGGLIVAVLGSQQQQDQRSKASGVGVGDMVPGGDINLDSRSTATQTVSGLQPGAKYRIVMSGAVRYNTDGAAADQLNFDSMWSDAAGNVQRECYCVVGNIVSVNGWRASLRDLVEPASYRTQHNPAHVYEFHKYPIGDASQLIFQIHDSNYSDNQGSINVKVYLQELPTSQNQGPTANAGEDQTITLPATVTLTGTGTDPDGQITAYNWTKHEGPAGGNITSPTSATTTITGLNPGVYEFKLEVTDDDGAKHSDTVKITVNGAGNQNPTVNAGDDKTITLPTSTTTVTATASDPDGQIVTYLWTKVSGPAGGTIVSPNSPTTEIRDLIQGTYVFKIEVTDNQGGKHSDTITITVNTGSVTTLNLDLLLHGIGKAGDSANPGESGGGNTNIIHFERPIKVQLIDAQNHVKNLDGLVKYNAQSGSFKGKIEFDNTTQDFEHFDSGVYAVYIKFTQSLNTIVPPGFIMITKGVVHNIPQISLVTGDINNDNKLSIIDYNMLLDCYSDFSPPRDCNPTKKVMADIDDDGSVNGTDLNLFIRELSVQGGLGNN